MCNFCRFKIKRKFLELVKDLFTSDFKVSVEHSDEIFKIFDGIALKGVVFFIVNITNFC